ncbi:hypothetical protein B0F90DRAFT_1718166 [Multifurca ochricompacta]|uniref:Orc1-like AAA ATPase domain-containing protein n=1 Tax=Multifurca ochricompacta TaxID=376703 RepID=A0AAD4QNR3_9AGAM|nr:hypothetical protein B0F90DRAFT_1718166 [Multifurca ochricompacta]
MVPLAIVFRFSLRQYSQTSLNAALRKPIPLSFSLPCSLPKRLLSHHQVSGPEGRRHSETGTQTSPPDTETGCHQKRGLVNAEQCNIGAGRSQLMDATLTALMGIGIAFVGGVLYYTWYKKNVLDKIEQAFQKGYDPALELVVHAKKSLENRHMTDAIDELEVQDGPWTEHLRRKEQDILERIIHGAETGHYFMILGCKGTGKTTMILDAMQANQADGVAMCDAHPDLEVFRLRLGKALNYEYNEDSQTSLFSRRDPREGGPGLDIERVMNKLEKVALRSARRTGKPLILVLNNVHLFNNDDGGRKMLLQLQQRAEAWAASGILTLVMSSDDFWPYSVLRKNASRMHVLTIYDLSSEEAHGACKRMRYHTSLPIPQEMLIQATSILGGRLAYLNRVSRARDMVEMARHMLAVEKGWLLSQIGLIKDCDDDVMDEQKWSSCSWLLLREFVKIRREQEKQREEATAAGQAAPVHDLPLPSIPYYKCRQIMTRADFLEDLDSANIISIDINHDVRPDSMLILQAAREVVEEEGFDDLLDSVRARIDEIESLHRTRELTFKDVDSGDRIRLTVDKGGARLVED